MVEKMARFLSILLLLLPLYRPIRFQGRQSGPGSNGFLFDVKSFQFVMQFPEVDIGQIVVLAAWKR